MERRLTGKLGTGDKLMQFRRGYTTLDIADSLSEDESNIQKALKVLRVPNGVSVADAIEIMKKHSLDDEEDQEFSTQEFEMGILELFDLEEDYDVLDQKSKDSIKQAIEDLFMEFDIDDKGALEIKHLEQGFRKFLPDNAQKFTKIIKNPTNIVTVEKLYDEIDADKQGFASTEDFEKFLEPYFDDDERKRQFAIMCTHDADENHSGNVSKLEFIKWSETRGYIHFINVLEGKCIPDSFDDSPRSFQDTQPERSSNATNFRSKTMRIPKKKEIEFNNIFANKNKEGLSKAVKKLQEKKKISDFQNIFKSIDFRAAIKDIKTLSHNSGLYRINPLELIRYLKMILKDYAEGFNEEEFIEFMFKYTKQEKLTAYQRKIRESALRKIFVIIDVDGNKVADYTELTECLVFLCGGSIEEKIESAFLLFDIDDTKTFSLDEFTDFIGVLFRIFLNFLSDHNPHYLELDYRELTEQTADKCFSDLQKSPAGEISHYELLFWVTGKRFLSKRREQILDKYKPPSKAILLKNKIEKVNSSLKRILNSEELISKIEHYRSSLLIDKINIYDCMEAFKNSDEYLNEENERGGVRNNSFMRGGKEIFNRHDFSRILTGLLIKKKVIDIDKKHRLSHPINKLFNVLDKNVDGIVEIEDILALTFCCNSSIGDRIKVLFEFYETYGDGTIGFEELQKYFSCCFTMCKWEALDIFDIDKLTKATAENCMKFILTSRKEEADQEKIENEKISIDELRSWVSSNKFGTFSKSEAEEL